MTDLDHYKKTAEALAEILDYCTKDHNVRNHVGDWFWDPERGGKDFSKFGPVLTAARDDINEFERRQRALSLSMQDPRSEHYILCFSALRMDGYKYQKATDLDTADVEVPEPFKPREWDTEKWEYRIKPRLRECVATVAAVHAKTKYNKPRKKPKIAPSP